jgi:hypothetical protein
LTLIWSGHFLSLSILPLTGKVCRISIYHGMNYRFPGKPGNYRFPGLPTLRTVFGSVALHASMSNT